MPGNETQGQDEISQDETNEPVTPEAPEVQADPESAAPETPEFVYLPDLVSISQSSPSKLEQFPIKPKEDIPLLQTVPIAKEGSAEMEVSALPPYRVLKRVTVIEHTDQGAKKSVYNFSYNEDKKRTTIVRKADSGAETRSDYFFNGRGQLWLVRSQPYIEEDGKRWTSADPYAPNITQYLEDHDLTLHYYMEMDYFYDSIGWPTRVVTKREGEKLYQFMIDNVSEISCDEMHAGWDKPVSNRPCYSRKITKEKWNASTDSWSAVAAHWQLYAQGTVSDPLDMRPVLMQHFNAMNGGERTEDFITNYLNDNGHYIIDESIRVTFPELCCIYHYNGQDVPYCTNAIDHFASCGSRDKQPEVVNCGGYRAIFECVEVGDHIELDRVGTTILPKDTIQATWDGELLMSEQYVEDGKVVEEHFFEYGFASFEPQLPPPAVSILNLDIMRSVFFRDKVQELYGTGGIDMVYSMGW